MFIFGQRFPKDHLELHQGVGVLPAKLRQPLQLLAVGVVDYVLLPLLVDTLQEPEPTSYHEDESLGLDPLSQAFHQGGDHELGDFATAIGGNANQRIGDLWI